MSTTTDSRSNKYAPRQPLKPSLSRVRSAISNGSQLFPDIDGRSAWMRRLRDLINHHVSDLGGEAYISEAERRLVRRAAMLTLQLEFMECRWATEREGEAGPKSLLTYHTCTNTLRRVLETLGLHRRQRDITPNPLDYARAYDEGEAA